MRRAFLKGVPFKSAPQRAEPFPSEDFVLSAQNKISEANFLRVPKSHFWQSAPHLPHTCGFCGKSEFARALRGVPFYARKERKPGAERSERRVFSPTHDFFFCQLKRKSVN